MQQPENPAIPAATVVLVRQLASMQVLMLHRTSRVAFGGMWVFPGGRIEEADQLAADSPQQAARRAAARETREEAGILAIPEDFVWFSHWTPPPVTPRRFATWFFIAGVGHPQEVQVDGGEIQDHQWIEPTRALAQQAAGEIVLAPPTWISLYQLSRFADVDEALRVLGKREPAIYETRLLRQDDGVSVAVWQDDVAYTDGQLQTEGPRHRLVMQPGGYRFENTQADY